MIWSSKYVSPMSSVVTPELAAARESGAEAPAESVAQIEFIGIAAVHEAAVARHSTFRRPRR